MARQRFIWPQLWDDPDLGQLDDGARLLYIGCFSLADDDGRLIGDPVYLKTQVFRYRKTTVPQVRKMRDTLTVACSNFVVYEYQALDYIAFANWGEYQHPKYPKPSRLPLPPFAKKRRKHRKQAKNVDGTIPQEFPRDSPVGWVGLGTTKEQPTNPSIEDPQNPPENGLVGFDLGSILKDVASA